MRYRKYAPLLLFLAANFAAPHAFATAKDYRFEIAGPPMMAGKNAQVVVRLVHIPDNKAVTDAEITDVKFDMGPAGMSSMSASAKPMPAKEPGTYMIETQPSPWLAPGVSRSRQG